MFVLNESNRKSFVRHRKELEQLGISEKQYQDIIDSSVSEIMDAYDVVEMELEEICLRSPLLYDLILQDIRNIKSKLDYSYGLLKKIRSPDDDKRTWLEDRKKLLKFLADAEKRKNEKEEKRK